ncbi:MAG: hypothetical protein QOI76_4242 [Frankiales bacterium]|nr:hypothetical protein [Frankiales bacterium]
MTEQLSDFVAREMRRASADTADCPNLIHRVAAGAARRRARRRALSGALAAAAVAVAMPALHLLPGAVGGPVDGGSIYAGQQLTGCHGLDAIACKAVSVRAQRALRRANASDMVGLPGQTPRPSCLPRQSCRGPI